MNRIYQVYQVSDSTGETLDRIFLALQAQFLNFKYKSHQYAFTRTKNQITKILQTCKKKNNPIRKNRNLLAKLSRYSYQYLF